MKKILLTTLLFIVGGATALAVPDKKTVLDAIAVIETSHDGVALGAAIPTVIQFAKESPDVMLIASADATPWLIEEIKLPKEQAETVKSLLLASYAAGAIKAQLAQGKLDGNPYPGWLPAIKKYQELKQRFTFKIPGMEKLCRLQDEGTLQAFADEVARKNK